VDIVPVALVGTYELLPMNSITSSAARWRCGGRTISTAGLKLKDLEALSATVQKAVEDLITGEGSS